MLLSLIKIVTWQCACDACYFLISVVNCTNMAAMGICEVCVCVCVCSSVVLPHCRDTVFIVWRSALIWKPISYQFTFPSHSGFFLFLFSWCFHSHFPPCSQLKFPHAWAQYCDLELLAPVKYTKFCSLDAVEYRELLAKCFRRRCVELSRHGPVLALLGHTPLPQFF